MGSSLERDLRTSRLLDWWGLLHLHGWRRRSPRRDGPSVATNRKSVVEGKRVRVKTCSPPICSSLERDLRTSRLLDWWGLLHLHGWRRRSRPRDGPSLATRGRTDGN